MIRLQNHSSEKTSRDCILHPLTKIEACIQAQHHGTFLSWMGFKCYEYVCIFKPIFLPENQENLKSVRYG